MRSAMLRFQRELGDIVVADEAFELGTEQTPQEKSRTGQEKPSSSQQLYDLVVEQARVLIEPLNGAKNVLCTLNLVNTKNEIEIVSRWPREEGSQPHRKWGIVEYVGHTGQIYLIKDVEEYNKRVRKKGEDASRPRYVMGKSQTVCELAVPLMIQKRVVGVLNIEADKPNAYDESHIDMLFQFASAAVLAVRQTLLWRDLRVSVAQQNLISHLKDDREIFLETIEAAKNLGHRAGIWDLSKKISYPKGELNPRKKNGYTEWVSTKKAAVALGDRLQAGSDIPFECHRGHIDKESGLFTKWTSMQPPPHLLRRGRKKRGETALDVVTSLGFPIFTIESSDGKPKLGDVRAVMWVKSRRHFLLRHSARFSASSCSIRFATRLSRTTTSI